MKCQNFISFIWINYQKTSNFKLQKNK